LDHQHGSLTGDSAAPVAAHNPFAALGALLKKS